MKVSPGAVSCRDLQDLLEDKRGDWQSVMTLINHFQHGKSHFPGQEHQEGDRIKRSSSLSAISTADGSAG